MKIGVLTAMDSEYAQLASLMDDKKVCEDERGFRYTIGNMGANQLILRQCGIGKVNAAIGAVELIRTYSPDCMISTGVAGGIDKCLDVMDVVVSTGIVYHDVWCGMGCEKGQVQGMPLCFKSEERLYSAASKLTPENVKIHLGLICTGDQFITSRDELDKIKADFPDGLAVDMESAAIAQTCHIYGVPFVSFRIISDTPGADGHQQQYENFWATLANNSFGVTRDFLAMI